MSPPNPSGANDDAILFDIASLDSSDDAHSVESRMKKRLLKYNTNRSADEDEDEEACDVGVNFDVE